MRAADDINIFDFDGRLVAIGGIGKLFYESGFPISMSVSELRKRGIEVSMLHVADECMKNGWSAKTTIAKLVADFEDDIDGNSVNLDDLIKFCNSSYEEQREMIFEYLFKSADSAREFVETLISNESRTHTRG